MRGTKTFIASAILSLAGAARAGTGVFEWFAVSDLANVFEDGYSCPAPKKSIEVFGIRGEYVSAQAVIRALAALERVTVEMKSSLPSASVAWNFVGSVPVPKNTPNTKQSYLTRPAPAQFPDCLSESRTMSLRQGQYQPVWLTIRIPADAKPGAYGGEAVVQTDKGTASLPVRLTVYPLDMPSQRHLMVTNWYQTRLSPKFHETGEGYSDRFFEILKAYAENMAEHRQNVFRVDLSSVIITQDETGKLAFDFSRFDRWAEAFWQTGRMDRLETGFVATFGEGGHSSASIVLRDFRAINAATQKPVTIPGEQCLPQFLPALESHLRAKGWLEKTLSHIADEPTLVNLRSWKEASEKVHRYAPSLRRIDAIGSTDFSGALEVWVPKLNQLDSWFDSYRNAQREGNELWYYTCMHPTGAYPNRFLDFPLIDTRILHWLNYRFGITGYLHWGLNHWTSDPFTVPGESRLPPGDAWIVYPKKDGLLSSIRWETMRNGLQDYEYLWVLEDKIAKIRNRGISWIIPSQRGVEISGQVVREMNEFTRDPEVLYRAKKQIIQEILDMDRPPHLLVQTNPPEGSRIVYGPVRVELSVWTDPRTEILLNGKPVPVSTDGCFFTTVGLTPEKKAIVIKAKNRDGEKTVTRSFEILE